LLETFREKVLLLLSAVLIATMLIPLSPTTVQANQFRIVIDPGHGGRDPGAVAMHNGVQVRESDIVLDISLRIQRLFEQAGISVHMTRTTDVYVSLAERARIANDLNADAFVSVHVNAFTNSTANGTETFYIGNHGRSFGLSEAEEAMNEQFYEDIFTILMKNLTCYKKIMILLLKKN